MAALLVITEDDALALAIQALASPGLAVTSVRVEEVLPGDD